MDSVVFKRNCPVYYNHKMDKKELDANLSKVSKMLNSKDADNIINQIRKNNNI